MNINVLCVRAILQSFTLSFINTYNVQIYIIRADAGTPLSMSVCIVFWGFFCVSLRYLKLVFPLIRHLEVLSSCGQFLGSEIWQGFRLETVQGMSASQRQSNYRYSEQKRENGLKARWRTTQSSNHGAIAVLQHRPLKATAQSDTLPEWKGCTIGWRVLCVCGVCVCVCVWERERERQGGKKGGSLV